MVRDPAGRLLYVGKAKDLRGGTMTIRIAVAEQQVGTRGLLARGPERGCRHPLSGSRSPGGPRIPGSDADRPVVPRSALVIPSPRRPLTYGDDN